MSTAGQPAGLVSVVVVNHNRAELLGACLRSLLAQDYPRFEVIVVDNGSTDGSIEAVRSLRDPRLILVPLDSNRGFAGPCNVGIRRARGDFIALLNNDAEADPAWLSRLVVEMVRHPRCGMVGSRILFFGADLIDKAGHRIFMDGQNRGYATGRPDGPGFQANGETLFPDGCAALYRRTALLEARGFDEDFFAYADDADLGLRLRWLGWEARYCGEAVVRHRHSSTAGRYSPGKVLLVERNRIWLLAKNFPWPLVMISPACTAYRMAWNAWAWLTGRGAAGNFSREGSLSSLAGALARAWISAVAGLPGMWRKRCQIRKSRRISDREFVRVLWRYRIRARELALEDLPPTSDAGLQSPAEKVSGEVS